MKQQLQKDQGLFKQRVDDIQLRITSPTLTDKETNYGIYYLTIFTDINSLILIEYFIRNNIEYNMEVR